MVKSIDISPRKSPLQQRSIATVDVILEATIQVLLSQGHDALTTARVASRAGVSVGSVYQYFPNKQALLLAVITRHLDNVIQAVERVCQEQRGQSMAGIAKHVVSTYIQVKLQRPDASRALLALPSNAATNHVIASITTRGQLAICDLLASCRDARFQDPSLVAIVMTGSLIGPVQLMLTGVVPLERSEAVTTHLILLCTAYLRSVGDAII